MKKIFTLFICLGFITTASFAQYGSQQNRGNRQDNQSSQWQGNNATYQDSHGDYSNNDRNSRAYTQYDGKRNNGYREERDGDYRGRDRDQGRRYEGGKADWHERNRYDGYRHRSYDRGWGHEEHEHRRSGFWIIIR